MEQVLINFTAGLVESYPTLKELLASRVHQQGKPQKAIAADLDMSPSDLSRKLSGGAHDNKRNFGVDDLVRFIEVTEDTTAIDWLVERFYSQPDELEKLKARIKELESSKPSVRSVG